MDKWFFTVVCVSVVVASVLIHGFTVRYGDGIDIKVAVENSGGVRVFEAVGANSTLEFMFLRIRSDSAVVIAAMEDCVKALKRSTEQVEAAVAAFQACDVATQWQAFDDLRVQMITSLETSGTCFKDCFVKLSPDASEAAHQLQSACTRQVLSHSQVWMDAEELCWQYLDLEFNRIQLTESWWRRSSNASELSEP